MAPEPTRRWENKILRVVNESPEDLLANPQNWRLHPQFQQDALDGLLRDVGWIAPVIANETTGHLIDGHLRVTLAMRHGEPSVPVAYVALTPEEEAEALAAFDPIGALAGADAAQLDALLRDVSTGDAAVQQLLADLAEQHGAAPPDVAFPEFDESVADDVKYCTCPECGHRFPA